jgi:dethiobiotin synthetase
VTRPLRLVFVTGTGTEIGKTWWSSAVLRALRERGVRVAARKPAQSFEPGTDPTDADVLAAVAGESAYDVCPPDRWYARPLAPPMAADALGAPTFTIEDLASELSWPDDIDVGVVEGVGGPRSPLAEDGDSVDLARALDVDEVLLVADAGLGTINAVRLAATAFDGGPTLTIALNRFDPDDDLHRRNRDWLIERAGLDVVTAPEALASELARRVGQ